MQNLTVKPEAIIAISVLRNNLELSDFRLYRLFKLNSVHFIPENPHEWV